MLDTGFQRDCHPALKAQIVEAEWDFINGDDDTSYDPDQDDPGQPFHGSITLCAVGGYELGRYIGPAYNAHFILAKTEDVTDEQPIEEDRWVQGIEWADSLGADIVSSSLGYTKWYTYEDLDGNTAVTTIASDIAASKGIVVVQSAGNMRTHDWYYVIVPADADSIIAVGAVDSLGYLADFSSAGPTYDDRTKPEVCARGVNTVSASPFETSSVYRQYDGTSLSAPLVSGAAALILQAHPDWSPVVVRQAMMETADNASSPDNDYGWGIIDVMAAIHWSEKE
jgi:subtilisin family serine protease